MLLLCAACGERATDVATTVDEIRAGHGSGNRVFLGLDVLVTDEDGAAVACDAGELTVSLEVSQASASGPWTPVPGGSQQVRCTSEGGDYALVVDNSGSEQGYLGDLQDAATLAAHRVVAGGGRASLTRVSTESATTVPLTDDLTAIDAGVADLFVGNGWTALWDGVRIGNQTLGGAPPPSTVMFEELDDFCDAGRSRGIIVFTDGAENNSSDEHATPDFPGDGLDTTFDDLLDLSVGGVTTPIYAVGLGDEPDHAGLEQLALASGGRHFAIDDSADLTGVFDDIAGYLDASHRVCARVPQAECGTMYAHIAWSWTDGTRTVTGDHVEQIDLGCPTIPGGRTASLLLTISNPGIPIEARGQLAANAAAWASPVPSPTVLVVLDDNHHDEFASDAAYVRDLLVARGIATDYLAEPDGGLHPADLANYDVIWFTNPGYPPDDLTTIETLLWFESIGGGVVIQGDDMAQSWGGSFSMTPLTGLDFIDNGTTGCGTQIDNNAGGDYRVVLGAGPHRLLQGLEGTEFEYGDDIDRTTAPATTTVVADAGVVGKPTCTPRPVITAFDRGTP
jgi:hypothetical protein